MCLSSNLQIQSAAGLVRRLTRPGGRAAYYRMDQDLWENMKSFSKLAVSAGSSEARGAIRASCSHWP
jgi:DNA-binding transcriptional regulator GbsR (MarR family)